MCYWCFRMRMHWELDKEDVPPSSLNSSRSEIINLCRVNTNDSNKIVALPPSGRLYICVCVCVSVTTI